jgi:hypothetical protein
MRLTVWLAASVAVLAGCETDCDVPLKDCDESECVVVKASKLEDDGCMRGQPAACSGGGGGDDVPTPARRLRDGSCWVFSNSFIPNGFEVLSEGDPCQARLAASRICN